MVIELPTLEAVLHESGEVTINVPAHQSQRFNDPQPVDYPAGTIEHLMPGTEYWVFSDDGARRGEPTRYLAAGYYKSNTGGGETLPDHRLLGTITTPDGEG